MTGLKSKVAITAAYISELALLQIMVTHEMVVIRSCFTSHTSANLSEANAF